MLADSRITYFTKLLAELTDTGEADVAGAIHDLLAEREELLAALDILFSSDKWPELRAALAGKEGEADAI